MDGAISVVGEAAPTIAWNDYCHRFPGECSVDSFEPAVIPFSRVLWNVLVSTNTRVNASVKPRTDEQHWGVEDRWDFPDDGFGDCEDFQIFKRKLLVQAGLPRRALRIAVVIDEERAGHAVLMVRTDRGDLVLDNRTDAVLSWAETGYRYVKRESDAEGVWVSLGGRTSSLSTANRRQPIAAQADPR
jgi:predicted transglutaminase-like cysteine proteinase